MRKMSKIRKLFIGGVVFISLLSGSASSVGATTVTNSNYNNSIISANHVRRQHHYVIHHVRRNQITNRSNRSKIVVIRFNRHKEAEYQMKKHETVKVFGRDSKIPTLLNHTQAFFTKHHIKVTYSFKNHISWKQSWMHITKKEK